MLEGLEGHRTWKATLILQEAGAHRLIRAVIQRSLLLNSFRDTIDVTPFGTKWRSYRVGRKHFLYRLVLKTETESGKLLTGMTAGMDARVTYSGAHGEGFFHCDVARVARTYEKGSVAVDAFCEDARVFM